jgi:hypothetical protein
MKTRTEVDIENYEVTVSAEIIETFNIKATSRSEAEAKVKEMLENEEIDILKFEKVCRFSVSPITVEDIQYSPIIETVEFFK